MILKKITDTARAKFGLPALAVVTLNANSVLQAQICGTRAWQTDDSVSADDFFHIGSCSKSVLASIAARLTELDKIGWKVRFFEVFPEIAHLSCTCTIQ